VTTAPTTTTVPPTTTTTIALGSPAAVADFISVDDHKDKKSYVLNNDSSGSAPFNEATLLIVSAPQNAQSYRVHNDHIHYKSVKKFVGVDVIGYQICNNDGLCDTTTLTISVS
jgi:hypothetical protein